jgi:predicted nucleotidyltransferase/plasmid maintenance system antidote protein VapI
LEIKINLTKFVKTINVKRNMKTFAEQIKEMRISTGKPLRIIASSLDIDQSILSKIENGKRKASREQVVKLAKLYKTDQNKLLVSWLSDKLVYEISNEDNALEALQMAEDRIAYAAFQKIDRKKLLALIKKEIKKFEKIQKAWIYGSFSRQDDEPKSDIDIAIETDKKFSYFDLAEIQYRLENVVNRKIDIGFIDSFRPAIFDRVKPDLKLIYERNS